MVGYTSLTASGACSKLEPPGLAEVVAVDLVGERRRRASIVERDEVGLHVEVPRRLHAAAAQRAAERAEDRADLQRPERDRDEAAVERRRRG